MSKPRGHSRLAIVGLVVLVAIVTTGCGRRGLAAGAQADAGGQEAGATASPAAASATATPGALEPTAPATTGPSDAPAVSKAPGASPKPATPPLATPDLGQIQALLDEIDAALGADATADTDEGSSQ